MDLRHAQQRLRELQDGVTSFVSRVDVRAGVRAGLGVPFVGCGMGFGFLSSVEVPFMGQLLSAVGQNVTLADANLGGHGAGALRRIGHATSRLVPGVRFGTGCGIAVGYGYGAGLFLTPGEWIGGGQDTGRGTGAGATGGTGGTGGTVSARLDRLERRVELLERERRRPAGE